MSAESRGMSPMLKLIFALKEKLQSEKLSKFEMREVINRLQRLPITFEILQKTKIGATVNRIHKIYPNNELSTQLLIDNWRKIAQRSLQNRKRKQPFSSMTDNFSNHSSGRSSDTSMGQPPPLKKTRLNSDISVNSIQTKADLQRNRHLKLESTVLKSIKPTQLKSKKSKKNKNKSNIRSTSASSFSSSSSSPPIVNSNSNMGASIKPTINYQTFEKTNPKNDIWKSTPTHSTYATTAALLTPSSTSTSSSSTITVVRSQAMSADIVRRQTVVPSLQQICFEMMRRNPTKIGVIPRQLLRVVSASDIFTNCDAHELLQILQKNPHLNKSFQPFFQRFVLKINPNYQKTPNISWIQSYVMEKKRREETVRNAKEMIRQKVAASKIFERKAKTLSKEDLERRLNDKRQKKTSVTKMKYNPLMANSQRRHMNSFRDMQTFVTRRNQMINSQKYTKAGGRTSSTGAVPTILSRRQSAIVRSEKRRKRRKRSNDLDDWDNN